MPSGDRGRITSEVSTYVVIGGILPMKGSNNAPLLINFMPSTGPSGIMRLIQKLPVTPADHTQADANQLIRLQEPLSEYGSTPINFGSLFACRTSINRPATPTQMRT